MINYIQIAVSYAAADTDQESFGISHIAQVCVTGDGESKPVCTVPVLGVLTDTRREVISQALANLVALVFDDSGDPTMPVPFGAGVPS
jgi:hypothetical protein